MKKEEIFSVLYFLLLHALRLYMLVYCIIIFCVHSPSLLPSLCACSVYIQLHSYVSLKYGKLRCTDTWSLLSDFK